MDWTPLLLHCQEKHMAVEDDNVAHFDMDGSLADYVHALVRDLEEIRSPGEEEITASNIWEIGSKKKYIFKRNIGEYIFKRMDLIKSQPGWWLNLPPIEAGLTVLRMCRDAGFLIAVLTKGPGRHATAWAEKLLWCQKYIGSDTDVTVTFRKGRVYGKILYDDYVEYMEEWLERRPRGLGIMPVNENNVDFSHPNVIMYRGPEDLPRIQQAIEIVKVRKPGEPLYLPPWHKSSQE